jgi:hypothetical protein
MRSVIGRIDRFRTKSQNSRKSLCSYGTYAAFHLGDPSHIGDCTRHRWGKTDCRRKLYSRLPNTPGCAISTFGKFYPAYATDVQHRSLVPKAEELTTKMAETITRVIIVRRMSCLSLNQRTAILGNMPAHLAHRLSLC